MEIESAKELIFGMSYVELITIVALIIGPILAVVVTRFQDKREKRLQRKLDVFRALMKTRKYVLDPEHVGALNLIEMEFYGKSNVINAYRSYIDFRHEPLPVNEDDHQDRHFKRGENFLYDLLHEIGATLGYSFDKDDLKRFSYSPRGWGDDEFIMRKNANLLGNLLEGKIALPITTMAPQQQNQFPPAPKIEEKKNSAPDRRVADQAHGLLAVKTVNLRRNFGMKLSDGERLIALMLCDISDALKVKGELEPKFIREMICGNDDWAIKHKYHGLFHDEGPSDEVVQETRKILDAWRDITFSVKKLSDKDRATLDGGEDRYKFPGFDGNEPGHYGVASILLNKLSLFQELEHLDSHSNNIQMHRNLVANLNDLGHEQFGKRTKEQIEKAKNAR